VGTPPDQRRDVKLFGQLARGESEALAELYDRHAPALLRHAFAMTREMAHAEDVVQATFLKLATVGAPLLGVRRPASYLHQILRAAWIDLLRREARRGEQQLVDDVIDTMATDPATTIDVRDAVRRLSVPQREVLVLHLFNGFSFREIGDIVQVPTFTAASRYRLALDRLRQLLGGT
jgi:RNA polymerase sigma-70 factor (ECF subfamily)